MAEVENQFSRNELYWGEKAQKNLFNKHVLVAGLGGVGGYAVDSLARSGIGRFTLIDFDDVALSNINRQLIAFHSTLKKPKTDVMKAHILDINPEITVKTINSFYTQKLDYLIEENPPDFVVDAIDTLQFKIELIKICKHFNIPVITSLGAGNRIDPTKLYLTDISEIKSNKCSFLKRAVNKLKFAGIDRELPVVASSEKPFNLEKRANILKIETEDENIDIKKFTPASTPFVPPVAGYIMASYVVRQFLDL